MKTFLRSLIAALVVASGCVPVAFAQTARVEVYPLFTDYDLDTPSEGTDVDQVLTSVDFTADTTFTIDGANPDSCRELTATVTDTTPSINAGTLTITGTDCEGDIIVWAISMAGGAGTYNSLDLAEGGREDYYFATVTSIVSSADLATLGGLSDELLTVGVLVDTVRPISCVTYGGPLSDPSVDGSWMSGNARAETSGLSNTFTGVNATEDAFLNVNVGDEIRIRNPDSRINGLDPVLYRVVVTNADDDTITVNDPDLDLDDNSDGYAYEWRQRQCSSSDNEGWVPTRGAEQVSALVNVERYDVDAETGITLALQCKLDGSDPIIEDITSTGVTAVGVYQFNTTASYDFCRITMLLDSFDSATDTGAEQENLDGVMEVRYVY